MTRRDHRRSPYRGLPARILLALVAAFLPSAVGAVQTISNGVYEVHVQSKDAGDPLQYGSWTANTGPLHVTGAGNDLLWTGVGTDPTTSFSTLRIYRSGTTTDYTFGGVAGGADLDPALVEAEEGPSPLAPPQRGRRTVWNLANERLRIVQDVVIVGTTTDNSAIYHTVEIHNLGDEEVLAGLRNLYDYRVEDGGLDDGPSNALESVCGTPSTGATTFEFSHAPVTSQVVRVSVAPGSPTYQPLLALTYDPGLLAGIPITPPDEYAHVDWFAAFFAADPFDYAVSPSLNVTGDSAGLSWFGRTQQTALRIPAGESVRKTQALLAQAPRACPEPCVVSYRESVLCVAGQPGRFTYEVLLRNRSGSAIHDVQVQVPAGLTAELATLPLPIPSHHPRRLVITLSGAVSGDVVPVTLVFLNADGEPICSVEKLVRLPDCECAQIISSQAPHCFGFGGSKQFVDSFELENLFSGPVHNVVLSPVSPAGATLTPDVFGLAGPLGTGDESHFATRIGGVAPGGEVCYRISTHDPLFEECCSIERCVTVPKCTIDFDDFRPLGAATLSPTALGLLEIAGIDGGGDDGVSIDVGGASSWDGEWLPIELSSLAEGTEIVTAVSGRLQDGSDDTVVTMASRVTGDGFEIEADFGALGSDLHTVELYRGSRLVETFTGQPALLPALPDRSSVITTDTHYTWGGPIPASVENVSCQPEDGFVPIGCRPAGFTFSRPMLFDPLRGGPAAAILADEVRIYPEGGSGRVGELGEVTIRAAGVPSLTLAASNADLDCNANGVPDVEDVLGTESSDGNANGVPDECEPAAVCTTLGESLCLGSGRFTVEVEWRDFAGATGRGRSAAFSRETGYFWFFDPGNPELAVKVLDGRSVNGHWWVFFGALTNVEFRLTVTDVQTGASKSYFNPLGGFASVGDVTAIPAASAAPDPSRSAPAAGAPRGAEARRTDLTGLAPTSLDVEPAEAPSGAGPCAPEAESLCLAGGRFRVEVGWRDFQGRTGAGRAVTLNDRSGSFWFFGRENVELAVKLLDGRPVNGHWWFFYGALSNVEYTITVTDTVGGTTRSYFNPLGTFSSAGDTSAF